MKRPLKFPLTICVMLIFYGLVLKGENSLESGIPVSIPNGDFSQQGKPGEIPNWEYKGPSNKLKPILSDKKHQHYFSPTLNSGEKCELTSGLIKLKPYHQYVLEMDLKGGIFCHWRLALIYSHEGLKDSTWQLFPNTHSKGLSPAPAWEKRRFKFITPKNVTGCKVRFSYHSTGINPSHPGLDNVKIIDLGKFPIWTKPGKNLLGDPGFELKPVSATVIHHESAHSGKQFFRFSKKGWKWTQIGNSFVETPVIIRLGIWARGQGKLYIRGRGYSYGYQRLLGYSSPEFELTDKWKFYSWDFPLPLEYPELIILQFWVNANCTGEIDLDDAEMSILGDITQNNMKK